MPSDEQIHRQRNWVATLVTLVMLIITGMFVYRVLYYVDLIENGEIDTTDEASFGAFSTSSKLATVPLPDGAIDVTSDDDPYLGKPGALVTIVEFADFGCTYSRESSFVLRALAQKYGDSIYYIYRDFPITEIRPIAQKAAEAGECAHEQGRFWEYHDKLYQHQDDLDEDELFLLAEELNLDMGAFRTCLSTGEYEDEVLEDYADGVEAGVRGTPTFFINGNRIPGAIPSALLNAIVETLVSP